MCVAILTIAFGLVFPLLVTVIAQVVFHHQANGSLVVKDGMVIGSELIGQNFTGPAYFHPRPSAAGGGYDAANSGATNLGPTSDKLINGIHKKLSNGEDAPDNFDGVADLAAVYRKENGLPPNAEIPADAVTRSASGLDPHISPANAAMQVARVACARGLPEEQVRSLVADHTEGRRFAILGEPRVNVFELNMALDAMQRHPQ
jgi:K+-transporting ATPase ATPase C chain